MAASPEPWLAGPDEPLVRIDASRTRVLPDLGEVVRYRELLYFLTWRDVKVRYKQTVLGASWAIIQPLFTTVVFSIFFGRLAKVPSDDVPYYLFSLAATVPWAFFSNAVTQTSNSVVNNTGLVTKVYFPRLIVPLSSVLGTLVDFALALALLIIVQIAAGHLPGLHGLTLPLFVILAIVTALGAGTWLAALNAQFRDIRYAVPFLMQLWLFITPVAYPSSLLDEPWRTVYGLNPMAGVVEGFRWATLGTATQPGPIIVVSALVAVALLVSGTVYYNRVERQFADIV